MIFDLNPHILQLSFATPLPGSNLYGDCLKDQRIISDNWDDYVFLRKSIIRNDHFTAQELARQRGDLIRQFYFRPSKIIELIIFFVFRVRLDYLNCFVAAAKVIANIKK